jgi:CRP-like cAMP-binding protein
MNKHPGNMFVLAEDCQTYGPADATLLQQWAKEGLVSPQSWIYDEDSDNWTRAKQISFLRPHLAEPTLHTEVDVDPKGIRPGQIRRIRLLSEMTDDQAETFIKMVEKIEVRPFSPIVKSGEHGDAMFLILEGEARVTIRSDGKEDTIATLGVGDFFGEMALVDAGPRSADVTATKPSILLRLSKGRLETIQSKHPELAARFLLAMTQALALRIRTNNDHFSRTKNLARGWSGEISPPVALKVRKSSSS